MKYLCPMCDRELRKRAMNYPANLKRRKISSIHDRFVCGNCRVTFDADEVKLVEEEDDFDWW